MHRPLDLRHVVSPGLRDLIELANTHNFDRVTEQVRNLRGCTSPINLHGWTVTTDSTTKEVVRSYRSEDEPSGRLLTTCGNRRASRCPACSRVYAADTYHLVKAGLSGGKDVAETVRDHPRAFVTLTAPSFGPVHNRKTDSVGKTRPCGCGAHHAEDDPALGTPLDPATYDYSGSTPRSPDTSPNTPPRTPRARAPWIAPSCAAPAMDAATYEVQTASATCATTAKEPDRPNPSRPCPCNGTSAR